MSGVRAVVRRLLPFPIRLEIARLRRLPMWLLESSSIARGRAGDAQTRGFRHLLARHRSPLERAAAVVPEQLQQGKERNVAVASRLLDRLVVRPSEVFSFHRTIGRPSRRRGFRPGLELRDGRPAQGVGGGLCQVSNTLYLLALQGGMKIVERHRHGLDLFPDHQRTVPFGCGATVAYNYADLRFENVLAQPVILRFRIEERQLVGELWTAEDPGWTVEVYETDHRFFREGENWMRENRIRRRFRLPDGSVLFEQEVAHNRGRVLYECGERH